MKVTKVKPIGNMLIHVFFENGMQKKYDVRQLIARFPIFKDLEDEALFNKVVVDSDGFGISWNDEIDIAECELWENGVVQREG